MSNLIQTLKAETESLKVQYLNMTTEWAVKEFSQLRQWASEYQAGKFGYGEASKKYWKLPHCIINHNGTVEMYVEMAVKSANAHYEDSIAKLADRIEKKGLDISKIHVKTSHIGVNIETVLTDGNKTVKAFTIIAEGLVQRPHYRYLVK